MSRFAAVAFVVLAAALGACWSDTGRPPGVDGDGGIDALDAVPTARADAPGGHPIADGSADAPTDAAGPLDAAPDLDARGVDGGDASDASDSEPAPCLVDGIEGECLPTADCDGLLTPGLCLGPADIQCCTPEVVIDCSVMGVPGECIDVAECVGDRSPTPGLCPGPADIQCCTPNDGEGCDPSEMPTPNGGLGELPGQGGCPDGMVPVDDFCIDQYEAALVVVSDGDATEPWSPYHNPVTRRVRAVSLPGAVPQGYINGHQAAEACAEAGKRLCTNDEWLRACQGAAGTNVYPYGTERVAGWCNEDRPVHPAIEYFGTSADWIWSQLGNACINQLPDSVAPSGEHDECVSTEQVYDLVGNLHEWTSDPTGVFRGGYYVDTWRNGLGCAYRTTAHSREHWDYSTGFRCCY